MHDRGGQAWDSAAILAKTMVQESLDLTGFYPSSLLHGWVARTNLFVRGLVERSDPA